MNKLNSLRSGTYDAASKFLLAHEEYFACLSQGSAYRVTEAAKKGHIAGGVYKSVLDDLISHLKNSESSKQVSGELSRTEQLSDIVKEELSLISLPRRNANLHETDHHFIT